MFLKPQSEEIPWENNFWVHFPGFWRRYERTQPSVQLSWTWVIRGFLTALTLKSMFCHCSHRGNCSWGHSHEEEDVVETMWMVYIIRPHENKLVARFWAGVEICCLAVPQTQAASVSSLAYWTCHCQSGWSTSLLSLPCLLCTGASLQTNTGQRAEANTLGFLCLRLLASLKTNLITVKEWRRKLTANLSIWCICVRSTDSIIYYSGALFECYGG